MKGGAGEGEKVRTWIARDQDSRVALKDAIIQANRLLVDKIGLLSPTPLHPPNRV